MELNSLTAISPVDGRYRKATDPLSPYFSEFGLIRYRVKVEIEYLISLSKLGLPQISAFSDSAAEKLRNVYLGFSEADALRIKDTEKTTNHDVKAVEYFVKEKLSDFGFSKHLEFVHFGLTSQDINNTSIPLSIRDASKQVVEPLLDKVIAKIGSLALQWKEITMLARTHGQPASPTQLGKELYVFADRLRLQNQHFQNTPFSAKFGGATGNFNAHYAAYPDTDWLKFADEFVNNILGLRRSQFTTQVEHYDNIAYYCDALSRINVILLDLCRDIWTYISFDYFKQKLKEGEIGSSAMPHKVNPIDFENAEGNIGIANCLFNHFSAKLPVSRLQRDLTDSTVLRNIGMPLAHTLIAYNNILKGLDKLILNEPAIERDLENNWAVVAEAIQTVLRREGYPKPYEALKNLTRTNSHVTRETLQEFIKELKVDEKVKQELYEFTPHNYVGKHPEIK